MPINQLLLLPLFVLITACVTTGGPVPKNVKASAVNVQLGLGYLGQNNMEMADQKLNKALQQNPDSAEAHNAFAILQERLLKNQKAEYHYQRALQLEPDHSAAANNYGAFLCRNKRRAEAEKYFLQALENSRYKTPEFALTNAAICLLRIGQHEQARAYLQKALATRPDFPPALIAMARVLFTAGDYAAAKNYLQRLHWVAEPTAKSLWLALRVVLKMNDQQQIDALSQQLKVDFPDSTEYQSWLKIQ